MICKSLKNFGKKIHGSTAHEDSDSLIMLRKDPFMLRNQQNIHIHYPY